MIGKAEGAVSVLEGEVTKGLGRAGDFTRLEWVRAQLVDLVGIDPLPGTLNLRLDRDNVARWRDWRCTPCGILQPADSSFCRAHCYPVLVEGRVPAALLSPEVCDYPENKVELVAALQIRDFLSLRESSRLRVELCRPLQVKGVLFDLDGTLVDSVGAYVELARVAAAPFGVEVTREQVCRALSTGESFWRAALQGRADADSLMRVVAAEASRQWPRVLREHGKLFQGLSSTLDALKGLGIRLGIVSGARPEVLEVLGADHILERFDSVILGPDVSTPKPDPEGILKCLKELDIAPADALYVGDAPIDILASRAAGVRVASVLTGAADSAMLSSYCPDRLLASHQKLPAILLPAPC